MKTAVVVARLTHALPPRFLGRFYSLDQGLAEFGTSLWSMYHCLFDRDLDHMLRVLIDQLPSETLVTEELAASSDCEWACVFASCDETGGHRYDSLLVLRCAALHETDWRASCQAWLVVAVVDMKGAPPDWKQIENARPLDPSFRLPKLNSGAVSNQAVPDGAGQATAFIRPDEGRIGIYAVRLPQQPLHYVSAPWIADDCRRFYCTCSASEDAESPHCPHAEALGLYLAERRIMAVKRQERGLAYSGLRLEGVDQAFVFVWEGHLPALLDPRPSQQLANHSPDGFNWGYAGSGPAQLALAILLDYCGNEEMAVRLYQRFKSQFIASLPQNGISWRIEGTTIATFLKDTIRTNFTE